MTLPHLTVRKKLPFGYFAQGCEPTSVRFRRKHLFCIKKGVKITSLDAIYSHHKGIIPSQGTIPLLRDLDWRVSGGAGPAAPG
jgi:hypothetical protein